MRIFEGDLEGDFEGDFEVTLESAFEADLVLEGDFEADLVAMFDVLLVDGFEGDLELSFELDLGGDLEGDFTVTLQAVFEVELVKVFEVLLLDGLETQRTVRSVAGEVETTLELCNGDLGHGFGGESEAIRSRRADLKPCPESGSVGDREGDFEDDLNSLEDRF